MLKPFGVVIKLSHWKRSSLGVDLTSTQLGGTSTLSLMVSLRSAVSLLVFVINQRILTTRMAISRAHTSATDADPAKLLSLNKRRVKP